MRKFHHKMGVWLCHEVSDSCSGVVRLNADSPEDNQVCFAIVVKIIHFYAQKNLLEYYCFDQYNIQSTLPYISPTVVNFSILLALKTTYNYLYHDFRQKLPFPDTNTEHFKNIIYYIFFFIVNR